MPVSALLDFLHSSVTTFTTSCTSLSSTTISMTTITSPIGCQQPILSPLLQLHITYQQWYSWSHRWTNSPFLLLFFYMGPPLSIILSRWRACSMMLASQRRTARPLMRQLTDPCDLIGRDPPLRLLSLVLER